MGNLGVIFSAIIIVLMISSRVPLMVHRRNRNHHQIDIHKKNMLDKRVLFSVNEFCFCGQKEWSVELSIEYNWPHRFDRSALKTHTKIKQKCCTPNVDDPSSFPFRFFPKLIMDSRLDVQKRFDCKEYLKSQTLYSYGFVFYCKRINGFCSYLYFFNF